jgi:hypothetical protein
MIPDEKIVRGKLQQLATLADLKIALDKIEIKAEHSRPLPASKMAVYAFFHGPQYLKIGKVGPKSNARYASQHYNPDSSNSNLAKSILECPPETADVSVIDRSNVGDWIKRNTTRINILLPADWGIRFLTLAEAFLQCWLKPKYEGFESQRDKPET